MNIRSELHCHTKMSKMAGITDIKELIRAAKNMGMPAIAITDNDTVQAYPDAFKELLNLLSADDAADGLKVLFGVEVSLVDDIDITDSNEKNKNINNLHDPNEMTKENVNLIDGLKTNRAIMLATCPKGIRNINKMISLAIWDSSRNITKMPLSLLKEHRDGLIIGSCAQAGDVSDAVFKAQREKDIKKLMSFYDFIEVEPVDNYVYVLKQSSQSEGLSKEDIKNKIKQLLRLANEVSVPIIASANVFYLKKSDKEAFRVIRHIEGYDEEAKEQESKHHLMSTEEMLEEFDFLGETARGIVIDNPNAIVENLGVLQPFSPSRDYPEYPEAEKLLQELSYGRAQEIYGKVLPEEVKARIDQELEGIINNGFSSIYMIAFELVKRSNKDGYIVGSRGASGSSFISFLLGITETNPLPAHYICKNCGHVDFIDYTIDSFYAGDVGMDLPDKTCPKCGERLLKDGYDLPVEPFLGVNLDKEPDFDFNFSGDYQNKAQESLTSIDGIGEIYRPGTTATVSQRLALRYVTDFCEKYKLQKTKDEISELTKKIVGIKRGDRVHPGGVFAIPKGTDIYSYSPVTPNTYDEIPKTQIDYTALDGILLKLDLLSHNLPTALKYLYDATGINPETISLEDKKVLNLFSGTDSLGVKPDLIDEVNVGTLGIPEYGNQTIREMFEFFKPKRFSDIIRILGIAHSTWDCDPLDLIITENIPLSEFICNRDDIMIYLTDKGLDRERSFNIMESVRKGIWQKKSKAYIDDLRASGISDSYIGLFDKIEYLFPKAHCANYALLSWRLLYYKLYYPEAFYNAWFKYIANESVKEYLNTGYDDIRGIYEKQQNDIETDPEELDDFLVLMEMNSRGINLR